MRCPLVMAGELSDAILESWPLSVEASAEPLTCGRLDPSPLVRHAPELYRGGGLSRRPGLP